MSRSKRSVDTPLYTLLRSLGVRGRYAREVENLRHHCGLSTFEVDSLIPSDMTICSCDSTREMVEEIVRRARVSGTTVVILSPYLNHERGEMCDGIISRHRSTTVNRLGYLIIFNNHLPKQHFTL